MLHQVAGKLAFDFTFQQALQQLDSQVALGQVANLGKKFVIQEADVGLLQTHGVEDVDHAFTDYGLIDDLTDGGFSLLVSFLLRADVTLGQDDLDGLHERHFVA